MFTFIYLYLYWCYIDLEGDGFTIELINENISGDCLKGNENYNSPYAYIDLKGERFTSELINENIQVEKVIMNVYYYVVIHIIKIV